MVAQFIHGTRYIDELVMMRAADKGDLYYHQGERSERERAATGKADMDVRDRPATCPKGESTKRTTGGANWNVIALTDQGGSVVERYLYKPYGQMTVHEVTSYGDRDGDGDVDATDKGTPGTTCTGTVSGACRILDLDFDGDYDAADATLFDSLPQGNAQNPGRTASSLGNPFGHHGLPYDAEIGSFPNRARQYNPGLRRFMQRDPLEFLENVGAHLGQRVAQTTRSPLALLHEINLYEYLESNPCVSSYPTGPTGPIRAGVFDDFGWTYPICCITEALACHLNRCCSASQCSTCFQDCVDGVGDNPCHSCGYCGGSWLLCHGIGGHCGEWDFWDGFLFAIFCSGDPFPEF